MEAMKININPGRYLYATSVEILNNNNLTSIVQWFCSSSNSTVFVHVESVDNDTF